MVKESLFVVAAALLVTTSVSAQNAPSQDTKNAPTGWSATPDKPPVTTVPEAATDVGAVPRKEETKAGQVRMSQGKWVPKWIVLATNVPHPTKSNAGRLNRWN